MTPILILAKGWVIGISIAAPVGPIGLLCIRRTLAAGMLTGLVSGLGAACADAVYGTIAVFGVAMIAAAIAGIEPLLRGVGGLFLLWLAWTTLRVPSGEREVVAAPGGGLARAFLSTFALTLTNPATVLSFAAFAGGLGVATGSDAGALIAGVFAGSASWWLILAATIGRIRSGLSPRSLARINRVTGIIAGTMLGLMGAAALGSLINA